MPKKPKIIIAQLLGSGTTPQPLEHTPLATNSVGDVPKLNCTPAMDRLLAPGTVSVNCADVSM